MDGPVARRMPFATPNLSMEKSMLQCSNAQILQSMLKSKIEDSAMPSSRLVMASASPRRAELLRAAGIDFDVMPADIDETMDAEEWPDGYVRRIALTKAEAVRPQAGG